MKKVTTALNHCKGTCYIYFFFVFFHFAESDDCWKLVCVCHSFWSRFKGIHFVTCVNVTVNISSHPEEEKSLFCLNRSLLYLSAVSLLASFLLVNMHALSDVLCFKCQADKNKLITFRMQ